jgi:queuine/archaeosine tRNA-ribosyltransferase
MPPLIALETPKQNFELQLEHSDYIFALAHLWEDSRYRNFVFRAQAEGKAIYLDNSAFELKTSIEMDKYISIIREIKPQVIVVPDALGNIASTIKLTKTFYQGLPGNFFQQYKFMIVPQGKDNRERMKCFHIMRSFGFPAHVIGLPRHACPHRVELLKLVKKFLPRTKIHFLGLPDPEELRGGIAHEIDTIDTSWVAKYSVGKGGYEMLNFESDICDPDKFNEGLEILTSYFNEG